MEAWIALEKPDCPVKERPADEAGRVCVNGQHGARARPCRNGLVFGRRANHIGSRAISREIHWEYHYRARGVCFPSIAP